MYDLPGRAINSDCGIYVLVVLNLSVVGKVGWTERFERWSRVALVIVD
jgi:hypothetical protein